MDWQNIPITDLIPQSPPFVMVDRVLSCDNIHAVTAFEVREDNIFLDDQKLSPAGIIENMAGFTCPDCGKLHKLFGESHIEKIAEENGVDTVCRIPINPKLAAACDAGLIELYEGDWLDALTKKIESL